MVASRGRCEVGRLDGLGMQGHVPHDCGARQPEACDGEKEGGVCALAQIKSTLVCLVVGKKCLASPMGAILCVRRTPGTK